MRQLLYILICPYSENPHTRAATKDPELCTDDIFGLLENTRRSKPTRITYAFILAKTYMSPVIALPRIQHDCTIGCRGRLTDLSERFRPSARLAVTTDQFRTMMNIWGYRYKRKSIETVKGHEFLRLKMLHRTRRLLCVGSNFHGFQWRKTIQDWINFIESCPVVGLSESFFESDCWFSGI